MTLDDLRQLIADTANLPPGTEVRIADPAWCRGRGTFGLSRADSTCRAIRRPNDDGDPNVFEGHRGAEKWGFDPDEWDDAEPVVLLKTTLKIEESDDGE